MVTPQELIAALGLRNARVTGEQIICSCPFPENHAHGDNNPSFGIELTSGSFLCHCFGCGYGSNGIGLCMDLGMSRKAALAVLHPDLTYFEAESMLSRSVSESAAVAPLQADISSWLNNETPYWHQRGFNDASIGKWQLGYDSEDNRAVVPIRFKKELVGWCKRTLLDPIPKGVPKWQFNHGLEKKKILFGMDDASCEDIVLVEAPLSVVKLDQYGIPAVASFGCSLSDNQAVLLRSHFSRVLIWYDPDDAGRNGTAKAIEKLKRFLDVFVVSPTRDDPAASTEQEAKDAVYNKPVTPGWFY